MYITYTYQGVQTKQDMLHQVDEVSAASLTISPSLREVLLLPLPRTHTWRSPLLWDGAYRRCFVPMGRLTNTQGQAMGHKQQVYHHFSIHPMHTWPCRASSTSLMGCC